MSLIRYCKKISSSLNYTNPYPTSNFSNVTETNSATLSHTHLSRVGQLAVEPKFKNKQPKLNFNFARVVAVKLNFFFYLTTQLTNNSLIIFYFLCIIFDLSTFLQDLILARKFN